MLFKLFWVFTRVALFSWGGGPASLALMQREVTRAGWVNSAEFADAVALGNALPGPIAPQVSAYVGYKMAGVPGAIAAAAGTVLPATLLMIIILVYFFGIKDSPAVQSMLKVVRPVVVGFLLWTAYDMAFIVLGAKKTGWGHALTANLDKIGIVLGAFLLLTFTRIHPILLIAGSAALGILFYR